METNPNTVSFQFTLMQQARWAAKKPLRLPRKLKKDIIKVAGRDSYNKVMQYMACQVLCGGSQYIRIRKA